jgi:thioredoxin-like negative regulator of GroEL
MQTIENFNEFQNLIKKEEAILVYFSHEKCNVCKVLKPKVAQLLSEEFPQMKMYYSDTVLDPETAAQNSIFAVPSILVFFSGKEFARKSRNIGIDELYNIIERPYGMIF